MEVIRMYVTIQISSIKLKNKGSTGRTAWGRRINWKKIWPLNSEGPPSNSSKGRINPYICIHFTRTHWLSIAVFQTYPYCVLVGRMLHTCFLSGRARMTTCVEPPTRKLWGSGLSTPDFTNSFSYTFLYRGPLRFHLGFALNSNIICLGRRLFAW